MTLMLAHLRATLRDSLPPRLVHAYRVLCHTVLWPTEHEMVTARQFLSPEKIAVDVGANVGLFTSVLARRSKEVIAFEPNQDCAAYLEKVAPRNCEIIAQAVSDREGVTELRVPMSGGVAMDALATIEAANRFDTETRATGFVSQRVETVTLDGVLLNGRFSSERVGFINIDAEGHEFAVLRGGEVVIASHRPVLLIELEYRHSALVAEVFDWLRAHRYIACALTGGRDLAPIDPSRLRALQDERRLAGRLAGNRHAGYVNNIFFLPAK